MNRLDEIIQFNPLSQEDILEIARIHIQTEIVSKLEQKGFSITIQDDVIEKMAQLGYSPEYGARELKRTITRELKNPLSNYLLKNADDSRRISISLVDEAIAISNDDLVLA